MTALDGSSYYLEFPYDLENIVWNGLNEYYASPKTAIAIGSYHFGVKSDYVFAYSGLTDIIYLLFSIIPFKRVYLIKKEFPVYKYVLSNLGAIFLELKVDDDDPYSSFHDLKLPDDQDSIFVVSKPNSLFGFSPSLNLIEKLIENNPHVLFVIDEAYQAFSSERSVLELIDRYNNFVCLRTASKEFSIPSIRLAWLITSNKNLLELLYSRTYNTVSHLSELFIDNVVERQRNKHSRNIVYIINERKRIEQTIINDSIHIYRGSQTCMISSRMNGQIYQDLKLKCYVQKIDPLYLNDIEVCKQFVLDDSSDCFVRFNVWSKQVNDQVIEILNTL